MRHRSSCLSRRARPTSKGIHGKAARCALLLDPDACLAEVQVRPTPGIRHTDATRAAEREVPPDILQENLGQADRKTTARYYRAQLERRRKAIEKAFVA